MVLIVVVAASSTSTIGSQNPRSRMILPALPACHHEAGRTADAVRRENALTLARNIVRAEKEEMRTLGRYEAVAALGNLGPTPDGFELRLYTDGRSFVVSLKDRTDPCRFGIFSDQDGEIYQGSPGTAQIAS
jgi:hypothetical protein